MPTENKIKVNPSFLHGQIRKHEENEEERKLTVTVVASTEHPVKRHDFWSDKEFFEVLDMRAASVRTERLENGLSVLNSHNSNGLENLLGTTTGFSFEKKELLMDIEFSKRDDVASIIQDIDDGILKFVSIGYRVHEFKEDGKDDDDIQTFRAVDWEPLEVSFVSVPADPGASVVRECQDGQYAVKVTLRNAEINDMPKENKDEQTTEAVKKPEVVAAPSIDEDAIRKEAIKLENIRQTEIRENCRSVGLNDEFADTLCKDVNIDINQAREVIINERAKQDQSMSFTATGTDHNPTDNAQRGIENLVYHLAGQQRNPDEKSNNPLFDLNDNGRRFMGGDHRFNTLLRTYLNEVKPGPNYGNMDSDELLARSTTSDLPNILADSANKTLTTMYQEAPKTFEPLVKRTQLRNFHVQPRNRLSSNFKLKETNLASGSFVPEGGNIQRGTLSEVQESIALKEYSDDLFITRQMVINDDLNAFAQIPVSASREIINLENELFWDLVIKQNKALISDAVAFFNNASHANDQTGNALAAAGALAAVKRKMRIQQNLKGDPLNLLPRYLIVPPVLEETGLGLVTPLQGGAIATQSESGKNAIARNMDLIVEPRLDASFDNGSDTIWYIASVQDPDMAIEMATLSNAAGLTTAIQTVPMTNVGIKFIVQHDGAVQPMNFRSWVRSAA